MSKTIPIQIIIDEMWAALAAYQPQADAAGHGVSWAHMCKEKTYSAAAAAADAADADAAYSAAYAADAADADAAYSAAYSAAYAADAADAAAAYSAVAEKWAQKAIDKINKMLVKPAPAQQEPVAAFSFQMQLQPGWGSQYPTPCVIGNPDLRSLFGKVGDVVTFYASPQPPAQRKLLFKEFIKWAGAQGYDCAQTCNSDTGEWIVLNPMTADLWKAWQAAHDIKEKNK